MQDLPIGLTATGTRQEFDSMGAIDVPADKYYGAQTARSLVHFSIGDDRMPKAVYHAYGFVKKACALVNQAEGRLPAWKAQAIIRAADETIAGQLDDHYPLYVWQTGSGTQSNMNVNEVLSNRAIQLLGGILGSQQPVAPNDDVNLGQSSNDTFPTAMHIAALDALDRRLLPEIDRLAAVIETKAAQWMDVVKIGRTHLEDATPLTVGKLPQNEPGSSIMPGKVNPTQCEAIVMIAIQVLGDDSAVAFAGSQGNFELNAMRPIIINAFLHSATILADGCEKFRTYSVEGTQLNEQKIASFVENSLMLVTALSPVIGYQNAAHIAEQADASGSTLRAAALASGHVDAATFDLVVNAKAMVGKGVGGA
jgi:fumarate hydratase class II